MTGFLPSLSFFILVGPRRFVFASPSSFFILYFCAASIFGVGGWAPPKGRGKAYRQGTWLSGATYQNPNQKQVQSVDGYGIEEQAQTRIKCPRAWAV
ncbi:hypothetical protein CGRA01v4_03165 [Colletotrichum graminicola]|nr:hypothetical protein CGRA01v4_03165 [Colletotrichum graminicola]